MKQWFSRISRIGLLVFCITFGLIMALLQTTYTENQLEQAGQKYLIQLGKEYGNCSLEQKQWYNDQLFCLYQDKENLFVIGFSKNEWFPKRFSPGYFYYPEKQTENDPLSLYSSSEKQRDCYTYVIFGPRPDGVQGIEVDVMDYEKHLESQYCYHIDEQEEYIFYILQKFEDSSLSFQYRLYS